MRSRRGRRVVLASSGAALLALAAVVFVRTTRLASMQPPVAPLAPEIARLAADPEHLAGALRLRTISTQDGGSGDSAAFVALHRHLETAFPRAHAALGREVIGGRSLLYTWRGSDSTLAPLLLLAHLDVVPVEAGSEGRWTHPPFAGRIADGFIWGRGALDDKLAVAGLLEAAEALLAAGFQPRRTVLLAFGHDEELGGTRGAAEIAALLARRYPRMALIVDEGSVIAQPGLVPGVRTPVALVGLAEKASLSVELAAEGTGGHSSMPPAHTAAGVVSRAVQRLEAHPRPARLAGVSRAMFDHLAPELPFAQRVVFANLWLFRPLVERRLVASPAANAMIRTTTAATMLSGSPKENVLPIRATAVVNFRILPGDSTGGVLRHVRAVVDDSAVTIRVLGARTEPSGISDPAAPEFALLARTVRQAFPEAIVAPYLMVGGTDARHYERLSPNVYRFLPVLATAEDLARLHGTNERLAVDNYTRAVRFYAQLMRNGAE